MANRSICSSLLRATAARRWLSTESAAAVEAQNEKAAAPKARIHREISNLFSKAKREGNVIEALNKAFGDGVPIQKWQIVRPIKQFRHTKQYNEALKLSEWMESSEFLIKDSDRAMRIELLAKAKNLDSAEEYFNSLEESAKNARTYGSLLNCYCMQKRLEKASELFEKMKEVNAVSTLNYNNMINLYIQTGQPEKVPAFVQEMEQKNIGQDSYTCNLLIKCYGKLNNVDAAEAVLEKMHASNVQIDAFTYGHLAAIYVNAGLGDMARGVLEKMEKMADDLESFHTLMTLNARISDLSAVYRVWESLKAAFPKPGSPSYLVLLSSLSKLGDFENLERYFREWESQYRYYDVRVSNILLDAYLKRDMIKEAELLFDSVLKRGAEPNLGTLELLTSYYVKNSQFDLALKYLEMGTSKANKTKKKWVLSDETVKAFLKYFEENKDADTAEKFKESLKMVSCPDSSLDDSVLSSTS